MNILRVEYAITDQAAFLSHLEVMKTFERTIRRARVPIAFSEGFNPHPKLAIAAPLSVGIAGKREYLDIELRDEIGTKDFLERMNENLPEGFEVLKARLLPKTKPLMAVINAASYRIQLDADKIDSIALREAIKTFLEQQSILVERKTQKGIKSIDVRKGVYEIKVSFSVLSFDLEMLLAMGNEGNVRPNEVMRAIFDYINGVSEEVIEEIVRTGLYIYKDGKRVSPMNFGSEALV